MHVSILDFTKKVLLSKEIEQKIDVIIPVLDRQEETIKTLNSLFLNNKNINVIVVDNGSDDLGYLDKFDLTIIRNEENKGVVYAFNQGLDIAKSDYIVVMHNDVVVNTENWINKAIKFMEENEDVGIAGIAGFKKVIIGQRWVDLVTTIDRYKRKPNGDFEEVAVVDGCCNVIKNIGLRFDNIFGLTHFYDYDISMQYRKQGYKIFIMKGSANHLSGQSGSTIGSEKYKNLIGKSDGEYYSEREKIFAKKWKDYLPVEII